MQSNDIFFLYGTFKLSLNSEMYLLLDINIRHIKCIMMRIRFDISDIAVHPSRYRNVPDDALHCPLCKNTKRDQMHFYFAVLPSVISGISSFHSNIMKIHACFV